MRLYVNHHQDDWVDWISTAEFVHNNRVHSATGFSPFYVNMGYHPNCGTNISTQATNESSVDFVRRMEKVREDASAKLERAETIMKAQYDRRTPMEYQLGDMVWLSAAHIPSNRHSKKLDHKFLGPYKVVRKMGASAYQLTTQGQSTRHATFNEQLLKPYKREAIPHRSLTHPHLRN